MEVDDTTERRVRGKRPRMTIPAGRLVGHIKFEGATPEYTQLGDVVERLPSVHYLAVQLIEAHALKPGAQMPPRCRRGPRRDAAEMPTRCRRGPRRDAAEGPAEAPPSPAAQPIPTASPTRS